MTLNPAFLLATLAAGLIGLLGLAAAECPSDCVCMWKNGKETTECVNKDKDAIPMGIEPSTQVLDLRGNNIKALRNDVFLTMGITNLQRIYCSYCKISEVEPKAFRRLTNLVELDLSENVMREVPSEAWKNSKALMRLNLSGNPIKLIRSGAFQKLQFVTNLALSHCEIETLEVGAFDGMDSLLELKLESNKLNYLQGTGLFPKSLHHLQIHDNPFRCDCRLLDFAHWTQSSGIPRGIEPACQSPSRLQNRTLTTLDLHELACLPQVSASSTPAASNSLRLSLSSSSSPVKEAPSLQGRSDVTSLRDETANVDDVAIVETIAGRNVSLRCTVFGIPSASVSWWHDNRLVSNGSKLEHAWEDQDDDGAFYCAAQNPAGVARANFSIRVIESLGGGGGSTSNQSLSNGEAKNQNQIEAEVNMFKVEYILGFGAAAVIVLTIIIVLILYLILQCRSHRRKHRAALRAAGIPCDSNSNSYMERSTVDFIVPGEMELTSAVRSVSCGNSNSMGPKCLSNNTGHNGGSLGRGGNLPTNKDDGSGHEGDDEDEYGGGHGMTKTASTSLASSSAGSLNKSAVFHGHPLQQLQQQQQQPSMQHQPVDGVYPRQYPMLNGYLAGGCNSWQPPSYRHPPPPPHMQGPDLGYGKPGTICHCCGEVQMAQQFYNPVAQFPLQQQQQQQQQQHQQRPMYPASYVNGGIHFKNCPRAVNFNMPEKRLSYNEGDSEHLHRFPGHNHFMMGNPGNLTNAYSLVHRTMPIAQPYFHNTYQRRPNPSWAPVGILRNGHGTNFGQQGSSNHRDQFAIPQTPNSDQEEMRYGPFSDGEADRLNKRPISAGSRGGRGRARRQSTSSYCGTSNVDHQHHVPPHYVTLSRATLDQMSRNANGYIGYHQQFEQHQIQSMVDPCRLRYNSQPHLDRSSSSISIHRAAKDETQPNPKIALPVKPVKQQQVSLKNGPSYQQPVSQQVNRIADDEYLFPDLPPPPDALLDQTPPPEQAFFQIAASNGHTSSSFQNSRSSSLDDLQWVTSAADMPRSSDQPQLINNVNKVNFRSNTLPYEGRESRGRSPIVKQNGNTMTSQTRHSCYEQRHISGAVRVDLSYADKTIRRPGSAPELAVKDPVRSVLRRQHTTTDQHRSRSSSSSVEPQKISHGTPSSHKVSSSHEGSNSNKRVMFSGVSDGESPSESQDDVWVLRQEDTKDQLPSDSMLSDDSIPVTGIVIARPQLMCRPVVVPAPQYVLARVETHPTPSFVPNSMNHSLGSPMTASAMATTTASPRKIPPLMSATNMTTTTTITTTMPFSRACSVPTVRPPPPPPPPRTTPVVTGAGPGGTVRPPNPVLQRPSLQQRGNFHESPDEGYHEDDAGSEAL